MSPTGAVRGRKAPPSRNGGRGKKRRVMVVTPHPPFPLNQGGNIRLWSLCRELKKSWSFTLVSFAPPALTDGSPAAMAFQLRLSEVFDDVHFVPFREDPRSLWNAYDDPAVWDGPSFRLLGEKIQTLLRARTFDLVQVEHLQMASCRRFVWGPPVVLTEHDIGWVRLIGSVNPARRALPLGARLLPWARGFWNYQRVCRTYQGVVLTSPTDVAWWRQWGPGGVPAAYVPTGVDLSLFPRRPEPDGGPELVFVGYFNHEPNSDAARYFLDDIWPLIKEAVPGARATFVGANPPVWLAKCGDPNVRATGAVPEVATALAAARVFIAPIRIGYGVKGKLLEAFAAGVPVVCTPRCLAGFEPEAAGLARTGADAREFANETVNLLKNPNLRRELADEARRWVEQNRSWGDCALPLDRFYQMLVKNFRWVEPEEAR